MLSRRKPSALSSMLTRNMDERKLLKVREKYEQCDRDNGHLNAEARRCEKIAIVMNVNKSYTRRNPFQSAEKGKNISEKD